MSALELRKAALFRETDRGGRRTVFENLDLSIETGERVALCGPNGAGKTTLMLAAVGATPFTGEIWVDGVQLTRSTLEQCRREIGFVFSEPADQMLTQRVDDEVRFGLLPRMSADDATQRVNSALAQVGLTGYETRRPLDLSLGEQRRLALACALALQPRLLLIDEPTANLDPVAREATLDALAAGSTTLVFATHDLQAARELATRVLLFHGGQLVADGPAKELLDQPQTLVRAGLARDRSAPK